MVAFLNNFVRLRRLSRSNLSFFFKNDVIAKPIFHRLWQSTLLIATMNSPIGSRHSREGGNLNATKSKLAFQKKLRMITIKTASTY